MRIRLGESTKGEKGFTIVELLVTMAASLIVLGAIGAVFTVQSSSYTAQEKIVVAQENARAALQLMTKELLMAGYDPSGDADAGIEIADASVVQFTMDTDGDGSIDATGSERIKYTLDTAENQVQRQTGSGTAQPIGENIQTISFSYYDCDGNELTGVPLSDTDKGKVTRVVVEVTPILSQSAGLPINGDGTQESVTDMAYAHATRAWELITDLLAPSAYATSEKAFKDGVSPPNLGKTLTTTDTSGGAAYKTVQDDTWADDSSSSSSSS